MKNTLETMSKVRANAVRKKLREEFAAFFITMTTETEKGWPGISNQEFVNALADSLMTMGERRELGTAYLQTLIYELQDRVNTKL